MLPQGIEALSHIKCGKKLYFFAIDRFRHQQQTHSTNTETLFKHSKYFKQTLHSMEAK
jgi:hypothetical protein